MPKGRGAQGYAQKTKRNAGSFLTTTSNTTGVKSSYRSEKAKTGAKPKARSKMVSQNTAGVNKMDFTTTTKSAGDINGAKKKYKEKKSK